MRSEFGAFLAAAALVWVAGCDSKAGTDAAPARVWWFSSEGVVTRGAKQSERKSVTLPGWMWVSAAYACPPALALGPKGEAVITSNVVPTLWRIDAQTLAVSVHPLSLGADQDRDVGFSSLTYSAGHAAYFGVSGLDGSLWKIDSRLTKAEKILERPLNERSTPCAIS